MKDILKLRKRYWIDSNKMENSQIIIMFKVIIMMKIITMMSKWKKLWQDLQISIKYQHNKMNQMMMKKKSKIKTSKKM